MTNSTFYKNLNESFKQNDLVLDLKEKKVLINI